MWSSVAKFNKTVWLIIIATLVSRFTAFMVWPYLALILFNRFALNELQIGLFLSVAVTFGALFGFLVGYLSDKYGRRRIILVGLLFMSAAMFATSIADSLILFLVATIGGSIARGMIENPGRALLTDMLPDRASKDMALHTRYFALNVGASIGPLVGVYLGTTGRQSTFAYVGIIYVAYFLAAALIFRLERPLQRTIMAAELKLRTVLAVLSKDRAFLMFVVAAFLGNIAYGQLDATLLQYFRAYSVVELTTVYALMILVNGGTIVLLQFPLLKILENWPPMKRAMLGVALFAGGFLGFAFVSPHATHLLLVSMAILSIGEAILFPTINIITDRMAPEDMKGSYVGAAGINIFGFSLAPLIGGFLLFSFGGIVLWVTMAAIALTVSALFYRANFLTQSEL